jgi:hypothetical protein
LASPGLSLRLTSKVRSRPWKVGVIVRHAIQVLHISSNRAKSAFADLPVDDDFAGHVHAGEN